jgi:hypothetical protein
MVSWRSGLPVGAIGPRPADCLGGIWDAANSAVSPLHVRANRMLRSAHRPQELVLYHFLARLYQSKPARRQCSTASRRAPPLSTTVLDEANFT